MHFSLIFSNKLIFLNIKLIATIILIFCFFNKLVKISELKNLSIFRELFLKMHKNIFMMFYKKGNKDFILFNQLIKDYKNWDKNKIFMWRKSSRNFYSLKKFIKYFLQFYKKKCFLHGFSRRVIVPLGLSCDQEYA